MAKIFDYESQGCLHEMFDRQVRATPNAVVVVAPASNEESTKKNENNNTIRSLTLLELDRQVSLVSKYLREKCGVAPDSCVGIYMEKCPEYVVSYAAILKAGGGYMPLDVSYPKPLLSSILEEATPKAICTKPEFAHLFENEQIPLIVFDADWSDRLRDELKKLKSDRTPDSTRVSLDNLAYLVYSSGTTGKPKGIRCPHRGAVFSYHWRHVTYPFLPDDRVACNVFFVWEMFRPILKGIPMYIIPDDVIYDPTLLCKFVGFHEITRVLFTPSLFEAILSTQTPAVVEENFRKMRIIWLCGEVVTVSLLRRAYNLLPRVQILNLYSISECHDVAAVDLTAWFKESMAFLNDTKTARKFAPVGTLLPEVKIAIMDDHFQPQPIGKSGEIFVGGPALALEYVNRPEINAKKFLRTPDSMVPSLGPRLYRTGDWGYLLADGSLEICGRCDTMVKVRGYSVEIQAIEAVLLQISGISACVVIVKGEEGEDKYLVAYVVIDSQNDLTRKEIRASLKYRLPFYMIPSYFVFLPQLPLLAASSKVDKKALPPVDRLRDVIEPEALPSTPTEIAIAKLWTDVLELSVVDVNDSFFDLGGHSLLATKLLNLLRQEFGLALSVREFFTQPTVADLARIVDGKANLGSSSHEKSALDLAEEVELHGLKNPVMDLHLRAFWQSLQWNDRWKQGCVLLTGATGFLGSFLLRDILQKTQLRVVCIVRETLEISSESRLWKSIQQISAGSSSLHQEFKSRVLIFKGDVALTALGLSEDDYQYLACDVDFVIHAAAYVNLIYPYSALRGCNVIGTQNVLAFCYANKIKPLHYISTNGIFPNDLQNCEEHMNVDNLWTKLTDGYGQSKWVSEQLVARARQRGLPVVIYRLGNQAGDSKSSSWNPQDFTYLMLYGCALLGAVPEVNWRMEMTPVDFTTDVILELSTTHFSKSVGKTFHLINVQAPHCQNVFQWMSQKTKDYAGYEFEHVSYDEWLARIRSRLELYDSSDSQLKLLERLLDCTVKDDTYFSTLSTYGRGKTDVVLAQIGFSYPIVDAAWIQNSIRRLRQRGHLPNPKCLTTKPLANLVCVVTGASSGIGEAISKLLALEGGAKLSLLARRVEKLDAIRRTIEENGGHAATFQCDVSDRKQVLDAFRRTEETFGKPADIVINNAGVMHYTLMKNLHVDEWQREIDVNVTGTMNVLAACLNSMVDRRSGHIVNITSDAGRRAFLGLAVYSGTKYFMEGMSSALRQEMVEFNVRVTNIQPGDVATEILARTTDAEAAARCISDQSGDSTRRILDPIDVARAVYYAVTSPSHCAINEILIEPLHAPV